MYKREDAPLLTLFILKQTKMGSVDLLSGNKIKIKIKVKIK
jgi:hypothetical protein